ncbi:MAG: hypothetical protein NC548_28420 [Lachnospiraceae bacterium]|nr:hypothetical protein [Lachnospiraceae bacterium]MCM1232017.1 hypothetical protein [Ruminococcus flavefaciens]
MSETYTAEIHCYNEKGLVNTEVTAEQVLSLMEAVTEITMKGNNIIKIDSTIEYTPIEPGEVIREIVEIRFPDLQQVQNKWDRIEDYLRKEFSNNYREEWHTGSWIEKFWDDIKEMIGSNGGVKLQFNGHRIVQSANDYFKNTKHNYSIEERLVSIPSSNMQVILYRILPYEWK